MTFLDWLPHPPPLSFFSFFLHKKKISFLSLRSPFAPRKRHFYLESRFPSQKWMLRNGQVILATLRSFPPKYGDIFARQARPQIQLFLSSLYPLPCSTKLHSTCFTDLDEIFPLAKRKRKVLPNPPIMKSLLVQEEEERYRRDSCFGNVTRMVHLVPAFWPSFAKAQQPLSRNKAATKVRLSPSPMSAAHTHLGMSAWPSLSQQIPSATTSSGNWPSEKAIL